MPSGRGGGGGSHFGGGSSGGGSHFGGSSSSRGYHRTRPMRFHFGRRVYVISSGKSTLLYIFTGLIIFMYFVGIALMCSNYKSQLRKIEADYNYYQDMVRYAEIHTSYQKEGRITQVSYNPKYDRYYYNYTIYTTMGLINGYTFCVYTEEDLKDIKVGTIVMFAMSDNGSNANPYTDSVPMDYIYTTLEDDGEYLYFIKQAKTNKTAGIVITCIATALLGTTIFLIFKFKKLEGENSSETQIETPTSSPKEETSYCSYCGAVLSSKNGSCPSCGARVRKK